MASELERFTALFETEDDLRKAIASLLRRIPDISGVQITHGTLERGKDIIFYARGSLGELRLNACVIKNSKISGSVDSNSGAMTVLSQVQQSLNNPYLAPNGEPRRISCVYVMTPFEVSQAALHSIEGALALRAGQVTFWSGGLLLELFKKHWPEFIAFESGVLGIYATHLVREIESDDPIGAIVEQTQYPCKGQCFF